ncbi:hypothetical protein FTX61_12310 [Nitriliruptoraceae bacterium ZYF776]|nr:hypothetical protein [Profundirhabdus halotolerans]
MHASTGDRITVQSPPQPTAGRPRPAVLDELPALSDALDELVAADRAIGRAVERLIRLAESRQVETTTGVAVGTFLRAVAGRTSTDVRMLETTVTVCRRFPALRQGFVGGHLSWAQTRAVVLKLHRLPRLHDEAIDGLLGRAIETATGDADPDGLAAEVSWIVADAFDGPAAGPQAPVETDRLALQPRLDGGGGTLVGELTPASFALLDAATDPGPLGGTGRAGPGTDADAQARGRLVARAGEARAARLLDRLRSSADGELAAPKLLLRADLDRLVDGGRCAVQALTTLAGGVMHCTPDAADRLLTAGAAVRLVVTDGNRPIGYGRARRFTPDQLRDVLLTLHDTCTEPGCHVAARVCDTDHAVPDRQGGRTDLDNLGPLCAAANRHRHRWQVTQTLDGTRRWTHPATGLSSTTRPATWRTSRHVTEPPDAGSTRRSRSPAGHARPGRDPTGGPPRPPPPPRPAGT